MGKKRNKGNRPTSKRGHDESNTNRYRQVTALIPVNRDNEPIKVPRKELAKSMLEVTGQKTTHVEQSLQSPEPKLPDNVVSLCNRRNAANEVEYSTSQEAQAIINYDRLLFHSWSKEKGKRYISEKERDAWGFRRLLEFSAAHPNGRNYLDDAALNKPKAKKQKPISTVHNPGISSKVVEYGGYVDGKSKVLPEGSKPLDPKFYMPPKVTGSAGKTPSGRLIREFTEGKYAPPATQQSPEVHRSKDWGTQRHNVSNAPRAWAAEDQLYTMIDMVPQQHWPMDHIGKFLFQDDRDGKWRVHTGKVRKAISNQEDRIINRAVTLAFIEYGKDQDEYVTHLESEVEGLQSQRRILEFQVSRQSGEEVDWTPQGARQSVRQMDKERATANAKPPTKQQLVAEQHRIAALIEEIEAEEEAQAQAKMQMIRLRVLFRQIPYFIWKGENPHPVSKARRMHNVAKERKAHRRMVSCAKRAEFTQRVNLSGLVIYLANEHWAKMKITIGGATFVPPTEHYVEVRATEVPRLMAYGADDINYKRVINKAVGAMNLPVRYQPIEPTHMLWGDKAEYAECDNTTARMRRWAKWLPGCEERDLDRQQQEESQASLDARQECIERNREVMSKPVNRIINKVSQAFEKAWQFGQRDVYVTPTERYKREENERILRERTRCEIEAQQKLDEEQRREDQQREDKRAARREERRRKKADKRAEQTKDQEQAAIKAAAKAAFRRAH